MKQRDIYDYLGVLAMILTPTAAAVFFGWRVWSEVLAVTDSVWLARIAAFATATSLEIVGIYAGHVAITFYRQSDWKRGTVAAVTMLAYVAIGVIELWGTIGAVVFLIAPLVYLLVALRYDARAVQTEQRETEHAQTERQWTLEDRREEREFKLAMRRLELEASSEPARVPAQASISEYECDGCGHMFGSQQAVNAHQRWCDGSKAAVSANGSGK